ncbi:MAG: hypothetical protein DWQ34_23620 [Planctomycetota bacterium]|nr:MAG: hypothetical protein DWQ29_24775 [Planctomycetota bacterium]REJ87929.1 MAG: hypothetical protein DWQ34_23620 [Planctomycetota bacterium]REK30840.1 MAG: hypothetical protein DWQ45_20580 [Planctomycetota bacterium]
MAWKHRNSLALNDMGLYAARTDDPESVEADYSGSSASSEKTCCAASNLTMFMVCDVTVQPRTGRKETIRAHRQAGVASRDLRRPRRK